MNKLPDLHNVLYAGKYDCVFVTESWLYADIPNGLLDPDNKYSVYRKDRNLHRGGGVCMFIANKLNYRELLLSESENFSDEEIDLAIIDIISKQQQYRFMLVYRRPVGGDTGSAASNKLCSILRRRINRVGPTFLIGDFNCPGIDWSFRVPSSNKAELPIYEFFHCNGFTQCVPEATRGDNTLDVVCTDEPILVSNISVQPPFADSDHDSVDFELLFDGDSQADDNSTAKRYLWSQGN